jgi:16S rRNA (cytidine1402-2'-O)-methyltransferase
VDRFTFLGFAERKGKARAALLERVAGAEEPMVLFESPQRLVRLLDELSAACGPERRVCVARELTKIHEEFVRGTLAEASAYYRRSPPRGEVCVVIDAAGVASAGDGNSEKDAGGLARTLLARGEKPSEVARELTRRLALPRNVAYRIVHDVANRPEGSS